MKWYRLPILKIVFVIGSLTARHLLFEIARWNVLCTSSSTTRLYSSKNTWNYRTFLFLHPSVIQTEPTVLKQIWPRKKSGAALLWFPVPFILPVDIIQFPNWKWSNFHHIHNMEITKFPIQGNFHISMAGYFQHGNYPISKMCMWKLSHFHGPLSPTWKYENFQCSDVSCHV